MLAADKALARLIDGAIGADPDRPTVCALSYSVSPHQIDKFFTLCEGNGLTVQQLSAAEMMAAVGEERRPVAAGDGDGSGEEEEAGECEALYEQHCDGSMDEVQLVLVTRRVAA